jgi:hypothetical protein
MAASKLRKTKMQQHDMKRSQKVPMTENEKVNEFKTVGILSKAQAQMDEELDDVKHMNQMVIYSKCVTI